jgi:predicted P-loop ATPase
MVEAVEARDLPWRKGGWQEWTDADDLQLAAWCQQRHAYVKPKTCAMAVQVVARDQAHHPVRERLNALKWDGTPRLDSWMFTCLGAAARADDGEKLETVEARQP